MRVDIWFFLNSILFGVGLAMDAFSVSLANGLDDDRMKLRFPTQYDVGVDNNNFKPISYREVKEIITKQCESTNEGF